MTFREKCGLISPYLTVLLSILLLLMIDPVVPDRASRSLMALCWFAPVILFTGAESLRVMLATAINKWIKTGLVLIWLIPSIPLMIMSLLGFLLICDIIAAWILA